MSTISSLCFLFSMITVLNTLQLLNPLSSKTEAASHRMALRRLDNPWCFFALLHLVEGTKQYPASCIRMTCPQFSFT